MNNTVQYITVLFSIFHTMSSINSSPAGDTPRRTKISVFCGARFGTQEAYKVAALQTGQSIAAHACDLVWHSLFVFLHVFY